MCTQVIPMAINRTVSGHNMFTTLLPISQLKWTFIAAMKVHISKQCYEALSDIGGYSMTYRGQIEVKVSTCQQS